MADDPADKPRLATAAEAEQLEELVEAVLNVLPDNPSLAMTAMTNVMARIIMVHKLDIEKICALADKALRTQIAAFQAMQAIRVKAAKH